MEIFVGHRNFFFWHRNFCWSWKNFVWTCKYFGMSILGWIFCGHLDDWPTLFCKTSRVEVASKCWKAHGRYCLQTLRTSSMKQASRISSKLYWIMIPMSTRISNYSLLCQSDLGHYLHFQFSRHWWGDVDTLWILSDYWLKVGWWKNQSQWFPHFKRD